MAETIPIGADHAGFALKTRLKDELAALGYAPEDVGAMTAESSDYAGFAHAVAERVERGTAARGILICGTGLGMAYAANRHRGVRAAVTWSPEIAVLSREHNDSNILVLPSRFLEEEDAVDILKRWLATPFAGGRHSRRIAQIEPETT